VAPVVGCGPRVSYDCGWWFIVVADAGVTIGGDDIESNKFVCHKNQEKQTNSRKIRKSIEEELKILMDYTNQLERNFI